MNKSSEPIVWVIQEGKNDYSPAENFGQVRFITNSDYRPMDGCQQNIQVLADIRKFKSQYVPGVDYIVPVGNPMVMILVTMAMNVHAGTHNFLKWDGRRATYIPFKFNRDMIG